LKDILIITPPFTQLNTPYPATAYLKGFFNTKDITCFQMDLGIEVILELFSRKSFEEIFKSANDNDKITSENCERIYALRNSYLHIIDDIVLFLQGKNLTFARQICSDNFLPQASRFEQLDDLEWAFGSMGMQDKAKHLATLFLEDLSDFIKECLDENFGFSRYAERLGLSANSFDELHEYLQTPLTFIDKITLRLLEERLQTHHPKLVCFSIPFPGNLYSGFRCAQFIKANYPDLKISMGGGFPNTELRSLTDVRVFEYFDFITLDDGELPVELVLSNVLSPTESNPDFQQFKRTFVLENGAVTYKNNTTKPDYKQNQLGTPDYADLLLSEYISVIEIANPMHSLWSDGRWNKLTMAHGCYWGKCTFCDVSLDYVKLYEPITANLLVDRMEELVAQTGETGFHFVDEAAPPKLMKALALEIIKRKLTVTWWTNIRFEKNFTQDLCYLLKESGCIAVSGGLEVASDRLLKLIDKGVSVTQVAQVTRNFTAANLMVHCYLMYGYPSQTEQETIDSLEMVRQLFELGIVQSGFWHQFALTTHSPIGDAPEEYGITPNYKNISFADNDVQFEDSTGIDHAKFSYGLKKSIFNYMHQIGFDMKVHNWFDFKTPKTNISPNFIKTCLEQQDYKPIKPNAQVIWLGTTPLTSLFTENKKGKNKHFIQLIFHTRTNAFELVFKEDLGIWVSQILNQIAVLNQEKTTYKQFKESYESQFSNFEGFWHSENIELLKENGMLVL